MEKILWHHAPPHLFARGEIYMVTAGTLYKVPLFRGDDRLQFLQDTLISALDRHAWETQAWAVFVNHYHFVARAPEAGGSLSALIKELHSVTAIEVNRLDHTSGRQVWFQCWDTCLTYEKSWLARLSYVNSNAVHHGLVRTATAYPYSSALWFEQKVRRAFYQEVKSFKHDKLKIIDDF
jgi:putative transposase